MQAIERETCPTAQHDIVTLVSHRQKRAAELLPNIMLAKRLLGEVRGIFPSLYPPLYLPSYPLHILNRSPCCSVTISAFGVVM